MKQIEKKIVRYNPDNDPNEIDYIANNLYNDNDLQGYYAQAKENKFDLIKLIEEWLDKLYGLVFDKSDN